MGTYLFCYACSMHFVGSVAAQLLDDTNPAWIPNIMMQLKKVISVVTIATKGEGNSRTIAVLSILHLSTIHKMKTEELYLIKKHHYSTTDTLYEDVSMDEIASQIVDEVSFTTMTEVYTVGQLDNVLDSDKVKSLQLDNQSLQDEVTELKSWHAPALTMELFENIIRMYCNFTQLHQTGLLLSSF